MPLNPIDTCVLVFLGIMGLMGYYHGFLRTGLRVAGFFVSWWLGLLLAIPIGNTLNNNEFIHNAMLSYIEGGELVHNNELARLDVSQLSNAQISDIMDRITAPFPVNRLIETNLISEVFVTETSRSVADTITNTIVAFSVNVLSFIIAFLIIRLLIGYLIRLYDSVYKLPVLKHFDSPIGFGLGLVNGFFLLFVVFTVLPILLIVLSQQGENATLYVMTNDLISSSNFGEFFYRSNFLLSMMKGT